MKPSPRKYTLADVLWERDVWRYYYDGMEALAEERLDDADHLFREALRLNGGFPGSYEGLAAVAKRQENEAEARRLTAVAFAKVLAIYPAWPRRLPWGEMPNRPILRIMQMRALQHHEDGNRTEAEELYRLLLKLNPSDNQGIRYLLAALREGRSLDEIR
jgi:tetratricopeptide (TPR) repeat protein